MLFFAHLGVLGGKMKGLTLARDQKLWYNGSELEQMF
jgi:hypothetical protein